MFGGIRLYDQEMTMLKEEVWDQRSLYVWTEVQSIPDNMSLIGLKANTFDSNYIRSLSFVLANDPGKA